MNVNSMISTFIIWIGGVFVLILFLSLPTIRKVILLRRSTTTWISALPEKGPVNVIGKATEDFLQSPLGGKACSHWRLDIEQLHQGSHGEKRWSVGYSSCSREPFEIADGTGKILVYPDPKAITKFQGGVHDLPADQSMRIKLEELGIKTKTLFGNEKILAVLEYMVSKGEEVIVTGVVQQVGGNKSIGTKKGKPLKINFLRKEEELSSLYKKIAEKFLVVLPVSVLILGVLIFIQIAR